MQYLILDFETDSLNTNFANPLTAHFLLADNNLNKVSELELTFRPEVKKDKWNMDAQAVHGITWDESQFFDDAKESFDKLVAFIPNKDICAVCFANYFTEMGCHYFDFSIIKAAFNKHYGHNSWSGVFQKRLSVHTMYKQMQKDGVLKKSIGASLTRTCEALGVKVLNNHNAKDDVVMTYECLKVLASKADIDKYLEPWLDHGKYIRREVEKL